MTLPMSIKRPGRLKCAQHRRQLHVCLRFGWPLVSFHWIDSTCMCDINEELRK